MDAGSKYMKIEQVNEALQSLDIAPMANEELAPLKAA